MQQQDENYSTQDYGLANWLLFNGLEFLGCVQYPGDSRKSFVFINEDSVSELTDEWKHPQTETGRLGKGFFRAHTAIKRALKESFDAQDAVA